MKKKIIAAALIVAMLAITAVGGSLAWFTATDDVVNTFTVGGVKIVQNEKQTASDGSLEDFEQDQLLYPAVIGTATDAADYENYIEKKVTVTSTDVTSAYVRTFIAVPTALVDYLHLDIAGTGWTKDNVTYAPVTVDGVSFTVISYTYNTALTTDAKTTSVLLKGVWLDETIDLQTNSSGVKQFCIKQADGSFSFINYDVTSKVKVLVASQACQSVGFANANAAIDAAFGAGDAGVPDFSLQ